jgi:hypothetical protein
MSASDHEPKRIYAARVTSPRTKLGVLPAVTKPEAAAGEALLEQRFP